MKKGIFLLTLFLLAVTAFAHYPARAPEQNQWGGNIGWTIVGGIIFNDLYTFGEGGFSDLQSVNTLYKTPLFNGVFPGSSLLVEYGITSFLSCGLRVHLVESILHPIRDGVLYFDFSSYLRWDFLQETGLKMYWGSEVCFTPLFAVPQSFGPYDGFILLFNTLSTNLGIVNSEDFNLYAYADIKHNVTLINPWYYSESERAEFLLAQYPSGITLELGGMHSLSLALGFDMDWGPFLFSLGYNLQLLDFSLAPKYSKWYPEDILSIFGDPMSNLECSWRYRF